MLHLVGFPPEDEALTRQLLRLVGPQDTLAFLDAGLRFAAAPAALANHLPPECTLLLIEAAGQPAAEEIDSRFRQTDHAGLVRASETHAASTPWFIEDEPSMD